jgi:hypothetical protein
MRLLVKMVVISTEALEIIFIVLFIISELIGMSKCESGGILDMFYILFIKKTPPSRVRATTQTVPQIEQSIDMQEIIQKKKDEILHSRNPF